jgi:HlyD family secretion protein
MQVDANVSESDIGAVAVGQPVTFRVDAYPDREFPGTVVQVRNAPINVQNVITYDVVSAVDNPKLELRPGMTATITITTAKSDDALLLPVRALRFRPERREGTEPASSHAREGGDASRKGPRSPAVWTLQPDGTLKRLKVRTGVQNESYAELVAGDLQADERVVVGYKRAEQASTANAQRPPAFMGGGGMGGGRRFH